MVFYLLSSKLWKPGTKYQKNKWFLIVRLYCSLLGQVEENKNSHLPKSAYPTRFYLGLRDEIVLATFPVVSQFLITININACNSCCRTLALTGVVPVVGARAINARIFDSAGFSISITPVCAGWQMSSIASDGCSFLDRPRQDGIHFNLTDSAHS